MSRKPLKRLGTRVADVHTKDSMRALAKLCETVDGELRIVGNPPLITPIEDVLPRAEQHTSRRRSADDPHVPAHPGYQSAPAAHQLSLWTVNDAASDIMLGWERIKTIGGQQRAFYVASSGTPRGSAEVEVMEPAGLEPYGHISGWAQVRESPRALG
jgi:hypothetical protein